MPARGLSHVSWPSPGGRTRSSAGGILPSSPSPPLGVGAYAAAESASVYWSYPANDGNTPITDYVILPYIGATPQAPIDAAGPYTSFLVTGLVDGTTYTFTVRAINAVGYSDWSAISNPVTPEPAINESWDVSAMFASAGFASGGELVPAIYVPPSVLRIQSASTFGGSGSISSISATFPSPVTAGNLIVIAFGYVSSSPSGPKTSLNPYGDYYTPTDTIGTPYAIGVPISALVNGSYAMTIFYGMAPASGTDTINILINGSSTYMRLALAEYSGVSLLDQTVTAQSTPSGTQSVAMSTSAFTTQYNHEVLLGWMVHDATPVTPVTPWSQIITVGGEITEDIVDTAAGSYTAQANGSSSDYWGIAAATFRPRPSLAPARIQSTSAFGGATSLATLSMTFPNPVTAGNLIVIAIGFQYGVDEGSYIVPNDSVGTSYLAAVPMTNMVSGSSYGMAIRYGIAPASGTDTITINISHTLSSCPFIRLAAVEYAGVGAPDQIAIGAGGPSTAIASSAFTTLYNNEVLFAWAVSDGNYASATSPWSNILTVGNEGIQDIIGAAPGSYTAQASGATSDYWGIIAATFRP